MTLLHPPSSTQERPAPGVVTMGSASTSCTLLICLLSGIDLTHTHTHTHTHTPRCSAHIAPPPLTQGSFVFPSLVSFALVCCGVNRVQSLGDKFCLTKQTPGELFGNAFEVKGQGRAMCKQCYRAMLTKGAKATSVCGIKNVIEYRYFAKCCMKVQSSSVMITLAYYIITENKTSEAKMLKFTTWSPVLASCS